MTDRYQQHGAFSWNELMTTDVEAAKQFYTQLLDWTTEDMQIEGQLEGMTYTVVKAGGEEVGGIMPLPPQARGTPPNWGSYVTVDDVDATAKLARELGAKTIVPPTDIPNPA
jgi:hypothetical protein